MKAFVPARRHGWMEKVQYAHRGRRKEGEAGEVWRTRVLRRPLGYSLRGVVRGLGSVLMDTEKGKEVIGQGLVVW